MDVDVIGFRGGAKNGCTGAVVPFKNGQKPPNLEKPWNLEMVGYLVCWFRTYWYIYFDVCRDEEKSASAGHWLRRFGTLRLMYWIGSPLDGHVMWITACAREFIDRLYAHPLYIGRLLMMGGDVSCNTKKYNMKGKLCLILTHCGRVTQICVFNTVKLGTSASSP